MPDHDDAHPKAPAGLLFATDSIAPTVLAVAGLLAAAAAFIKALAFTSDTTDDRWLLAAIAAAIIGGFGAWQRRKQRDWIFEQRLARYVDGEGEAPLA